MFVRGAELPRLHQLSDNTLISDDGSETGNHVEIVDSRTIEVTEGANDKGQADDGGMRKKVKGTSTIQSMNRTISLGLT